MLLTLLLTPVLRTDVRVGGPEKGGNWCHLSRPLPLRTQGRERPSPRVDSTRISTDRVGSGRVGGTVDGPDPADSVGVEGYDPSCLFSAGLPFDGSHGESCKTGTRRLIRKNFYLGRPQSRLLSKEFYRPI